MSRNNLRLRLQNTMTNEVFTSKPRYVCSQCSSTSVSYLCWYDQQSDEPWQIVEGAGDNCFCYQCKECVEAEPLPGQRPVELPTLPVPQTEKGQPMAERFVVITVDSDQQQAFTDCVSAADCGSALEVVLDSRDYCVHGAAFTVDELRGLADECEPV
jgi:hypothetical protein